MYGGTSGGGGGGGGGKDMMEVRNSNLGSNSTNVSKDIYVWDILFVSKKNLLTL